MLIIPFFRFLWRSVVGFVFLIFIYFLGAIILTLIPANQNSINDGNSSKIDVYVISDRVHTDICLPIQDTCNWDEFGLVQSLNLQEKFSYACFGWGDKNFYLTIPTWSDLTFSVAFKAGFGLSSAVMHVSYHDTVPSHHKIVKKIRISYQQYRELMDYIKNSFDLENGKPIPIPYSSDLKNDYLYEAKGSYSIFYTCNSWTNGALKKIGVKTATWAPFADCILYYLKD